MTTSRRHRAAALAAALLLALATAGCGGDDESGASPAGGGADGPGVLEGASFTVGSKDFGENIALGQMMILLLEREGATVEDKTNIKGTVNTRTALTSGEIDMYWEYTGTGWVTILRHTEPLDGPEEQYEAVAREDLERNGVQWSPPAELDNTYAFATLRETAEELDVATLSDVAELARTDPDEVTFCIESEFSTRDDGMPGLLAAYGIDVPEGNVHVLDGGVIYTETQKGELCNFGEVFNTSGHIEPMGLVVLEDDLGFFPAYQPALTARAELYAEHPELLDLVEELLPHLDVAGIRAINERIEVDGDDPRTVVEEWMTEKGLL